MVSRRTVLAAMAVVAIGTGCSTTKAPHTLDTAALDMAIIRAMSEAKIPGAMVGVWSPEGDYVKAFGVADTATGAPMKPDLYSRIGSVTKTFTATAVLQLADRGLVNLDAPIASYLDGIPGGAAITVRQLANMRSGLPDYQDNAEFAKAVTANPTRDFTAEELLGWAFAAPAAFPPGQQYRYSNTNYVLLGLLVQKVSGKALTAYLADRIFGPLAMAHSSFPTSAQFPDPHARGYTDPVEPGGSPVDATDWSASFTGAAGAIISTLDDMRIWMPALANGTLISPSLQQQRLYSPPTPGLPAGVGYGMGVFTTAGWIGHNGSVPGYQTVAIHLPQGRMTVVIMVNTDITKPGSAQPSTAVGRAVTSVLTPDHVYDV